MLTSLPAYVSLHSQVYYAAAVLLHYVVPRLLPVRTVQKGQPRSGQVAFEAAYSLGAGLQRWAVQAGWRAAPFRC